MYVQYYAYHNKRFGLLRLRGAEISAGGQRGGRMGLERPSEVHHFETGRAGFWSSSEGAKEYSPQPAPSWPRGRKPWVKGGKSSSPGGAQERCRNGSRGLRVREYCTAAFLPPLRGLLTGHRVPTACAPSASSGQAVGCILSPLRGWGDRPGRCGSPSRRSLAGSHFVDQAVHIFLADACRPALARR